jgi:hypothetical protein
MSVKMIGSASHGSVASTPAKAGGKGGAKQVGANKKFKNLSAVARRVARKAPASKSPMPSAPTAKGRGVFAARTQPRAFSNDTNVMNGGGFTKFVS